MRTPVFAALVLALAACVGSEHDLPPVPAPPTAPPAPLPGAGVLTAVGPTTLSATAGSSIVVQVRATKSTGAAVPGVVISWTIQAGSGSIQPLSTTTDGDGVVSAKWTLGGAPGVNLSSAVGGFAPSPVTFTVSTLSASASRTP